MKKLLAIVLALVLALCAVPALASELNWADFEPASANIPARFVTIDQVGLKMWVPDALYPVELSEEFDEAFIIAYYLTEDGTCGFYVQYKDVNGASLEEYAASLEAVGAKEVASMLVNGMPALSFDLPEDDVTGLAFATQQGYILQFTFFPLSDTDFAVTAGVMAASIDTAD